MSGNNPEPSCVYVGCELPPSRLVQCKTCHCYMHYACSMTGGQRSDPWTRQYGLTPDQFSQYLDGYRHISQTMFAETQEVGIGSLDDFTNTAEFECRDCILSHAALYFGPDVLLQHAVQYRNEIAMSNDLINEAMAHQELLDPTDPRHAAFFEPPSQPLDDASERIVEETVDVVMKTSSSSSVATMTEKPVVPVVQTSSGIDRAFTKKMNPDDVAKRFEAKVSAPTVSSIPNVPKASAAAASGTANRKYFSVTDVEQLEHVGMSEHDLANLRPIIDELTLAYSVFRKYMPEHLTEEVVSRLPYTVKDLQSIVACLFMAKLKPDDVLFDIGTGLGVVMFCAAYMYPGLKAYGIEKDFGLWKKAMCILETIGGMDNERYRATVNNITLVRGDPVKFYPFGLLECSVVYSHRLAWKLKYTSPDPDQTPQLAGVVTHIMPFSPRIRTVITSEYDPFRMKPLALRHRDFKDYTATFELRYKHLVHGFSIADKKAMKGVKFNSSASHKLQTFVPDNANGVHTPSYLNRQIGKDRNETIDQYLQWIRQQIYTGDHPALQVVEDPPVKRARGDPNERPNPIPPVTTAATTSKSGSQSSAKRSQDAAKLPEYKAPSTLVDIIRKKVQETFTTFPVDAEELPTGVEEDEAEEPSPEDRKRIADGKKKKVTEQQPVTSESAAVSAKSVSFSTAATTTSVGAVGSSLKPTLTFDATETADNLLDHVLNTVPVEFKQLPGGGVMTRMMLLQACAVYGGFLSKAQGSGKRFGEFVEIGKAKSGWWSLVPLLLDKPEKGASVSYCFVEDERRWVLLMETLKALLQNPKTSQIAKNWVVVHTSVEKVEKTRHMLGNCYGAVVHYDEYTKKDEVNLIDSLISGSKRLSVMGYYGADRKSRIGTKQMSLVPHFHSGSNNAYLSMLKIMQDTKLRASFESGVDPGSNPFDWNLYLSQLIPANLKLVTHGAAYGKRKLIKDSKESVDAYAKWVDEELKEVYAKALEQKPKKKSKSKLDGWLEEDEDMALSDLKATRNPVAYAEYVTDLGNKAQRNPSKYKPLLVDLTAYPIDVDENAWLAQATADGRRRRYAFTKVLELAKKSKDGPIGPDDGAGVPWMDTCFDCQCYFGEEPDEFIEEITGEFDEFDERYELQQVMCDACNVNLHAFCLRNLYAWNNPGGLYDAQNELAKALKARPYLCPWCQEERAIKVECFVCHDVSQSDTNYLIDCTSCHRKIHQACRKQTIDDAKVSDEHYRCPYCWPNQTCTDCGKGPDPPNQLMLKCSDCCLNIVHVEHRDDGFTGALVEYRCARCLRKHILKQKADVLYEQYVVEEYKRPLKESTMYMDALSKLSDRKSRTEHATMVQRTRELREQAQNEADKYVTIKPGDDPVIQQRLAFMEQEQALLRTLSTEKSRALEGYVDALDMIRKRIPYLYRMSRDNGQYESKPEEYSESIYKFFVDEYRNKAEVIKEQLVSNIENVYNQLTAMIQQREGVFPEQESKRTLLYITNNDKAKEREVNLATKNAEHELESAIKAIRKQVTDVHKAYGKTGEKGNVRDADIDALKKAARLKPWNLEFTGFVPHIYDVVDETAVKEEFTREELLHALKAGILGEFISKMEGGDTEDDDDEDDESYRTGDRESGSDSGSDEEEEEEGDAKSVRSAESEL